MRHLIVLADHLIVLVDHLIIVHRIINYEIFISVVDLHTACELDSRGSLEGLGHCVGMDRAPLAGTCET